MFTVKSKIPDVKPIGSNGPPSLDFVNKTGTMVPNKTIIDKSQPVIPKKYIPYKTNLGM